MRRVRRDLLLVGDNRAVRSLGLDLVIGLDAAQGDGLRVDYLRSAHIMLSDRRGEVLAEFPLHLLERLDAVDRFG